jgi:enoyl-CoA hydratase/carnithine racemase
MLQAGPEFAAWRAAHPASPRADTRQTVRSERDVDTLLVTLDRPDRHNAISLRMRDDLAQALSVAVLDESITDVVLRGNGPSFCSGGDLDEFGTRPDPATAHVTRLARSPARLIHQLAARTTVQLHGAAFGGGIEMAAFARSVQADPDTRIALPEVGLGLIPGAGGTVSVTRRIGRQRTAALALCGREIDATTALAWGLVDQITHPVSTLRSPRQNSSERGVPGGLADRSMSGPPFVEWAPPGAVSRRC